MRSERWAALPDRATVLSRRHRGPRGGRTAVRARSSELGLLEAERAARDEAERANDRLTLLASASKEIATSLDYERTLAGVARMAVPDLADGCTVDLLDGGELRQLAVAHVDPAKVTMAQELRRRYPPTPRDATASRRRSAPDAPS